MRNPQHPLRPNEAHDRPGKRNLREGRPPSRKRSSKLKKVVPIIFCLSILVAVFAYLRRPETYVPVFVPIEPDELVEYQESFPMVAVSADSLIDTGYLKLVNRELALSRHTYYELLVYAWPTVPVRATYITIHQTALNAIAALFEESRAQEISAFFITSGYRSATRQAEIYRDAVNRLYVLPAGHSEHQLGLAADILAPGVTMAQMSGTREAVWLAENAWRHGLILRYPYGTTHITGVAYEPWHYRYVGRIHAWFITSTGMVLEEYLEYLVEHGGFTAELDGVTYHVMYQLPVDGYVYVPRYLEFRVSASNRGGYVITAWE